ncbi:autotransporter-associated beta strand repeat-containing protein, partial [Pontiella sp.]|uniref:autotransporter-associated beta strand repeat-containing protein n=1 Tax=Pontiella sp. TaxID=2837462 RepID=UPI0035675467
MNKLWVKTAVALACVSWGSAAVAEVWTGAGDGTSYEDPLNWDPSTNAFPGTTRDIDGVFTVNRDVDVTVSRTFVQGGAALNINTGTHNDSQSGNTTRNYVGNNSAGTVNQSGGSWNIGHILLVGSGNSSGSGTYNLTGGDLIVSRGGNSFMSVPGGNSIEVGVGSASGIFEISGGSLATRIGVGVGSGGIFSVQGSGAASIGIGSNGSLDGDWNQAAGGTLRVGIDAGGVTKILIDDENDDGGAYATFDAGALLDVGYYNGMTNGGTWTVLEVEGTNIVDNGLAFATGVDTGIWSFAVDNSGANGLLTVTAAGPVNTYDITSIEELRQYAASNNVDVAMVPGTYWMTGEADPHFIEFSGTNNTFDLTGVHIKVDTAELAGYGGSVDVRMLNISGTNVVIDGLTLSMEKLAYNGTDSYGFPREYTADKRSQVMRITGSYITVKNCEFTSGGSYPYGYGDAFGKGSRPNTDGVTDSAWISHKKQSGILFTLGASFCEFENVTLNMRSFGHGIFFQSGAHDLLFNNCQVLGDTMADSDDIIAHPEYQEWGFATYKEPIPADIRISKHEGGFRSYGNSGYTTNGYNEYIENITLTNCRVERMRTGVAAGANAGFLKVYGMEIEECEYGYGASAHGTTLYQGCKGDAVNGPLIYFQYGVQVPAVYEVELTGDTPGHGIWPIALISGDDNEITLTSSAAPGVYSREAYVNTSQRWREWRHRPSADIDGLSTGNYADYTTGNLITNLTDQILVFGVNATANTNCVSTGGVINKGTDNEYVGETLVPGPIIVQDTWSYPPNPTNVPWAQYDSEGNLILPTPPVTIFDGIMYIDDAETLGGAPVGDGGTTVSNGTLEVEAGFKLQGENLVLSGSGTAGQGAVYSDGTPNNQTRLSSSSGTITLVGNAAIGVGISGNELLMGPMTGTGSLTKIGVGTLTLEGGANSFDGSVTISNGWMKVRSNKVKNDLVIAAGAGLRQNGTSGLNQGADDTTVLDGTIDINGRGITDTGAYSIHIGSLSGSGLITATSTAATQTVNINSSTADSAFNGNIEGRVAVVKNGAGTTLALNGTCTNTEGTFVNEGWLGGTGTLVGSVTLAAGGGVAPGNSVGTLTTGSQTWNGGALLGIEVASTNGPAGTGWDLLAVNGTVTLDAGVSSSNPVQVVLSAADIAFDPKVAHSWMMVDATLIAGGFSADKFAVDASAFAANNPLEGGTFSVSESLGDLYLDYAPLPYTALELWRYAQFGTYSNSGSAADGANPDGDARDNLLEYGTGSDPHVFNS